MIQIQLTPKQKNPQAGVAVTNSPLAAKFELIKQAVDAGIITKEEASLRLGELLNAK